jgi:hypothetical protein
MDEPLHLSDDYEILSPPVRCLRLLPGGRDVCPIDRCGVELGVDAIQASRQESVRLMFDLFDRCLYSRRPLRQYSSHEGGDQGAA